MAPLDGIEIREFRESDSISELTLLIRSAYKQLADMGLHFWATHQDENDTLDRVKRAHATIVATKAERLVATISLYSSRESHPCEHYRSAWYFGQFAVSPELQR